MKIEPMIIETENDKVFEQIALLIDREDFLNDIFLIREKFRLTKQLTLSHYHKIQALKFKHSESITKFLLDLKLKNYDPEKLIKILSKPVKSNLTQKEHKLLKIYENRFVSKIFRKSVRELTRKYVGYDGYRFYQVVACAIIYGQIPDENLGKSWFIQFANSKNDQFLDIIGRNNYFLKIHISDRVKKSDFDDMYHELKDILKKPSDTITNIRRDREWYWMHRNGMSYSQILKKSLGISKQGVIEAIKQYKKRLAIKLDPIIES